MKKDEITELERALTAHQSFLGEFLNRNDINESPHYLLIASQLRVLLTDERYVPILLQYAKAKGVELSVWAPMALPASLRDKLVFNMNLNVASWTPFFRSRQMLIEEFLDTEIGHALSLSSQDARPYTPRQVIKWVANKEGVTHLDFSKPQTLLGLQAWKWNSGGETYDDGLVRKIILQIGAWSYSAIDEVLNPIEDISIIIRLKLRCLPEAKIPFFRFRYNHSAVEIHCSALPYGIEFALTKNKNSAGQILVEFPKEWKNDTDAIFCFSYSPFQKLINISVNGELKGTDFTYDLGIIRTKKVIGQPISGYEGYFAGNVALYSRILSSDEIREILTLPFDWIDSLVDKQVDDTPDDT